MFGKKIKVCSKCSGVSPIELDALLGEKEYSVGCIGVCKKDRTKVYAKIRGRIVECDTKDELFSLIQEARK